MLAETAARVFADCAGKSAKEAWPAIDAAGLALVMVSETAGGFGGGWEDAHAIFFAAGEHAVSFPICEAIIAAKLLSDAALAVDGSLSVASGAEGIVQGGKFSGTLKRAGEGTSVSRLAALVDGSDGTQVIAVATADAGRAERRVNGADEGRDDLVFEDAPAVAAPLPGWNEDRLYRALALARASQMAGAIAAALSLSVAHTRQREQFGRPLAAFQAIQQQLAVLAEEAGAARAGSPPSRSPAPSCAPTRRRALAPPSPIKCMAPSASPASTHCRTSPGGCGPGAANTATSANGRMRSAPARRKPVPTASGRR